MNTSSLLVACAVVTGMVLLEGCTTQPRRVSCEDHLEPINAPAPKVAQSQDSMSLQQGSAKAQVTP
jgi:outer membrane murein-binding lipoprotein Lpp